MTSAQRKAGLLAAALVLVGCLAFIFFVLSGPRPGSTRQPLSDTAAHQLVENANLGLANLENHDTDRSIPIFTDIAERLTEDPLGTRGICQSPGYWRSGEDSEFATPQRLEEAKAALSLVATTEGASPEFHWLSAHAGAGGAKPCSGRRTSFENRDA